MTRCLQQPQAERTTLTLNRTQTRTQILKRKRNSNTAMVTPATTSTLGSVNDDQEDEDVVLDFSNVGKPEAAGRYPGQTGTWKFAENGPDSKAGPGKHIQANVVLLIPKGDDEEPKRRTFFTRYFLNEDSLWKFKQDMVALGADPADLEGANVRPAAIMRQIWGQVPTPLWGTIDIDNSYIPKGETQPRPQNNLKKLELRDADES